MLAAVKAGETPSAVAEKYGVHVRTVQRYASDAGVDWAGKRPKPRRKLFI